jgi:hypothetical protein
MEQAKTENSLKNIAMSSHLNNNKKKHPRDAKTHEAERERPTMAYGKNGRPARPKSDEKRHEKERQVQNMLDRKLIQPKQAPYWSQVFWR